MYNEQSLGADVVSEGEETNLTAGYWYAKDGMMRDDLSQGGLASHLFVWITITMLWIVMMLAIVSLVKYITHDEGKKKR